MGLFPGKFQFEVSMNGKFDTGQSGHVLLALPMGYRR
jgi:hypothetical protein